MPRRAQSSFWDEYERTIEKKAERRREVAPKEAKKKAERRREVAPKEAKKKAAKKRAAPPPAPKRKKAKKKASARKPAAAPKRKRARVAPAPPPKRTSKPRKKRAAPEPAPHETSPRAKGGKKSSGRHVVHHPPCAECGHSQSTHAEDSPHLCAKCLCFGYRLKKGKRKGKRR